MSDYESAFPEVMELYGIEDKWPGGWGRPRHTLEQETDDLVKSLLATGEPQHGVLESRAVDLLAELLPR